jgi:hypothetical protein
VVNLEAAARKLGRPVPPARHAPAQSMQITGNNNAGVMGNSNHVQINVHGVTKPKILITPGDNEVTNEQAAEIKRLVLKVAEVAATPHQRVYSAIYKRFETTSYQMIKRHRFEEVVKYLNGWIARHLTPSVPPGTTPDKNRLLARIHVQGKKLGGRMDEIHAFISGRFGTSSLRDLAPGQLSEVIKQFHL